MKDTQNSFFLIYEIEMVECSQKIIINSREFDESEEFKKLKSHQFSISFILSL